MRSLDINWIVRGFAYSRRCARRGRRLSRLAEQPLFRTSGPRTTVAFGAAFSLSLDFAKPLLKLYERRSGTR